MTHIKVLVVDDDNIIAKDIQNSLKKIGYDVSFIVNNGEEVIKRIKENDYDVVLMDIMLKGKMNGIETAKTIQNQYNTPVIFISTYVDNNSLSKAKTAEAYGYIMKPFKDKELQVTIEMTLANHKKDMELQRERDSYSSIIKDNEAYDSIFVRADYKLNKINFTDIYFVEALKDYVVIHATQNDYTTHTTMKEMIKVLPEKDFVRIHRSFIVNINKISSIKYPDLVIEDTLKVLPIGGLYRKELYNRLNMI